MLLNKVTEGSISLLIHTVPKFQNYRDISLVSRDALSIVLNRLNQIIFEKWLKLKDLGRSQILWLTRELVKNSVIGADLVVNNLMRQIAGKALLSSFSSMDVLIFCFNSIDSCC